MGKCSSSLKNDLMVFFLLALSGNRMMNGEWIYVIAVCIYAFFCYSSFVKDILLRRVFFRYILLVTLVIIGQEFIFGKVSVPGYLNYVCKIFITALVVAKVGKDFRESYLRCIYFVALVSIPCMLLLFLYGKIPYIWDLGNQKSIFIFNYLDKEATGLLLRNCGMFWEPGAFGGYICLVFLFYINDLFSFVKENRLKSSALIIALITTFSTTAYLVLAALIIYSILFKLKQRTLGIILGVCMIFLFLILYQKLDFMGEKLNGQAEKVSNVNVNTIRSGGRFGQALLNWYYIEKSPIFGNGFLAETRFRDHKYLIKLEEKGILSLGGNGLFFYIFVMGVPAFCYLMYWVRKNSKLKEFDTWVFILILCLILSGEDYLFKPMFLCLLFIQIYPYQSSFKKVSI